MSGEPHAETESAESATHEGELRAAWLAGQTSGRVEQKLDQVLEKQARIEAQNGRLEAQNVQILEQHNSFAQEVAKLASDHVALRQRITNLEAAPAATHHVTTIGAPATSVHDSLRAVALKQEQLDKKQDEQTSLLRSINGSKVLYAIGILLAGVLAGWVNARTAPTPAAPIYYAAPAPVTAPAPVYPRPAPLPQLP